MAEIRTLTPTQMDAVRSAVRTAARRAGIHQAKIWGPLRRAFGVSSYYRIPSDRFTEALAFIDRRADAVAASMEAAPIEPTAPAAAPGAPETKRFTPIEEMYLRITPDTVRDGKTRRALVALQQDVEKSIALLCDILDRAERLSGWTAV